MTIKISQLANIIAVQGNTIMPVVSNVTGTLTTVQANVQQLQDYIIINGVSADITALYANAATQSDLINGINANVTQANLGMLGYVNQGNTIQTAYINGQITAANAGVTASNVGMKGYVDQANTIQSAQVNAANLAITAANVGIIGYIDRANTIQSQQINLRATIADPVFTGNPQAPTATAGNATTTIATTAFVSGANLALKGYIDSQSFYSNARVQTYLPTYSGNIGPVQHIGNLVVFGGNVTAGYAFPNAVFTNVIFNGIGNANTYTQLNIQNVDSTGTQNSADFIATAPNGNDTSRFIDLGIHGNNYSVSSWTVSGPNDGYLYINSGNLTLGTETPNTTVKVHVNGTLASNVVTTFAGNGVSIHGNLFVSNIYRPTLANSVGTVGQISYDSSFVYICIGTNTWRRANLAVW